MKIRLIIDRLTGKAIMAGDKAIAVRSTSALNIQQTSELSQADYDALATKDTTTLYLITGTSGYVKAYIGDSPLYREPEPRTVSGTSAVVFSSIDGGRIKSLVRYGKCKQGSVPCVTAITQLGKCVQNGTPTPVASVDIMTNNGAIKVRRQSGLPLGYQRVQWLKPAGSITITGFKTKSTQEITTVFYRERSGSAYLYASDTATSGTTNTTAYLSTGGANWRWDGKSVSLSISTGIKITSVQKNDGVWLNGTRYGTYTAAGGFVSTNDLRLSSGENTTIRIESQTIREGETVTLDLVPVQRVLDGAYGFYDKVSGEFYTNAEATFEAGDPIPDPVEIYADGTPEVLTVGGKNLIDISAVGIEQGAISSLEGRNTNSNYRVRTGGYVPVKPSTQYTLSAVIDGYNSGSASGVFVLEFAGESTDDYTGINSGWKSPAGYTFTTGANTNFVRVVFAKASNVAISPKDVTNVQLEYGSTATAYEPYVQPQTVTDIPMLLGVGDYKDEAELIEGLLTHKVGVYVVTGAETITKVENASAPLGYYFAIDYSGPAHIAGSTGVLVPGFCERGVAVVNRTANMTDGTFILGANTNRIFFAIASVSTEEGLKEFFAANPTLFMFPLATETTEQTTAHPELTNQKYATASAEGSVDDITVTVTRGVTSTPTPYNPIPVICNNGEVTGQGAVGTPEVLTLSAAGETDQTATVVDLLQVGDYKDEHELIAGIKTGKIGNKVFDGTESFVDGANGWITEDVQDQLNASYTPLCTHFVGVASSVPTTGKLRVYRTSGGVGRIYFGVDKTVYNTADAFKAFLAAQYAAGTPVIVLYPLATPATEQVTPQPLICHMGGNTVASVCNVSDPVIIITYPE